MKTQKHTHTSGPWTIGPEQGHMAASTFEPEPSYMIGRITESGANWLAATPVHGNGEANAALIAAAPDLLQALRYALADLEGIMPEFEPSGDRAHPAWKTCTEAREAIRKAGVEWDAPWWDEDECDGSTPEPDRGYCEY